MNQEYKLTDAQVEKLASVIRACSIENNGFHTYRYDSNTISVEIKQILKRNNLTHKVIIITDSETLPIESESVKRLVELISSYHFTPKSLDKHVSDAIEAL